MSNLTRAEQNMVARYVGEIGEFRLVIQDAILRELSWPHAHFWATLALSLLLGLGLGYAVGRV